MHTTPGHCATPDCDQLAAVAICDLCSGRLRAALRLVVELDLDAELDAAATRTARLTRPAGPARRGTETPLPWDDDATRIAHALRSTLVAVVREVAEHLDGQGHTVTLPADSVAGMARWLTARIDTIARTPGAGLTVDEITAVVAEAERTVDLPPASTLAGTCPDCAAPVYAPPTATYGRCRAPGCAGSVRVDLGRAALLDAVDDRLAGPADAARIMTALGEPLTRRQVMMWHQRGHITPAAYAPARGTTPPRPLFRVRDLRARRRAVVAAR